MKLMVASDNSLPERVNESRCSLATGAPAPWHLVGLDMEEAAN